MALFNHVTGMVVDKRFTIHCILKTMMHRHSFFSLIDNNTVIHEGLVKAYLVVWEIFFTHVTGVVENNDS